MPDGRQRALGSLLAEQDAIVASLVSAIGHDIPAYAGLDVRQADEVRAIGGWTLRRVLELWAVDGLPGEDDARRFRSVGAARARDGRPLPAILRAYRTVGPRVLDHIIERYADALTVRDVAAFSRVYLALLDVVSEAIYEGYDASARLMASDREASLQALLADLVHGRQAHEASLAARLLELDARLPAAFVLLVGLPDAGTTPRQAAMRLADAASLLPAPSEASGPALVPSIYVAVDGAAVALLADADAAQLRERLRGLPHPTALLTAVTSKDAPRRYRLAIHALQRHQPHQPVVLDQGDLETIAVITGHPDAHARRMSETVLEAIHDSEDLDTVSAVLNLGSDAAAASELTVHPQTIRYRMRRIARLTGRDPRSPWDGFVLRVALAARAADLRDRPSRRET